MISNIDILRKKLLFRSSHRGTKEMDILLGTFFKNNYNLLEEKELLEFKSLLMITDKALSDWLIMNKNNSEIESIEISKKLKEFVTKRVLKN
ncbi:succinate dehydrogenase assembly factor 2 [Pelagibacteraceae bacterium]|jgi:succinate dehydrogenase flavin-adding protein (antitoxin of CptAB toxin-antitoxin module)|nr:succinate dehydrogenase assembly factor 2 [Pelagibacteraceae bacterium]MDC0425592.1 succinate dehydrogenase assembly factor 2 [Pelagibacteraceae bacterium]